MQACKRRPQQVDVEPMAEHLKVMLDFRFMDSKPWQHARSSLIKEAKGEFTAQFLPVLDSDSIERNRLGERMGDNTRLYGKCNAHDLENRRKIAVVAQEIRRGTSPYTPEREAADMAVLTSLTEGSSPTLPSHSSGSLVVGRTVPVAMDDLVPLLSFDALPGPCSAASHPKGQGQSQGQPQRLVVPLTTDDYARLLTREQQHRAHDVRTIHDLAEQVHALKRWWGQWHGPEKVRELVQHSQQYQHDAYRRLLQYRDRYPHEVDAVLASLLA
jgi:hypothetical protein